MRGRVTGLAVAALVSVTVGCGLPSRTYYDDLEGGDSAVGEDAESSTGDVTATGNDAGGDASGEAAPGDDGSVDAAQEASAVDSGDGSSPDGGQDAASDAGDGGDGGCGPLNTITNCGACGHACDTATSVGASCDGTKCSYTGCASGYADCNAVAPNTNGCETPTTTTTNCGGCGNACDTATSVGATCSGGKCVYTGGCNSGYADCNSTTPDVNGCETRTNTTANCGGCGIACGALGVATSGCTGTACTYTCSAGHSNCSTAGANTTGCECSTPACCGTGCQKVHTNGPSTLGLGQSWYDCVALGTYNVAQATAACVALKGAGGCSGGWTCGSGATKVSQAVICDNACTICWAYGTTGGSYPTTAGTVTDCGCPGVVQSATNWQ